METIPANDFKISFVTLRVIFFLTRKHSSIIIKKNDGDAYDLYPS